MKKLLLPGLLAVFALFLPSKAQAWPITLPYQIVVDSYSINSLVISTTNFPSAVASVNTNVVNDQWCLSHLVVSSTGATQNVTIAWSTSTLTAFTTDYLVATHPQGIPYDEQWGVQSPYCAPTGQAVVKITASGIIPSTITVEGYLWKGMSP